jgi:hypothetical protein
MMPSSATFEARIVPKRGVRKSARPAGLGRMGRAAIRQDLPGGRQVPPGEAGESLAGRPVSPHIQRLG